MHANILRSVEFLSLVALGIRELSNVHTQIKRSHATRMVHCTRSVSRRWTDFQSSVTAVLQKKMTVVYHNGSCLGEVYKNAGISLVLAPSLMWSFDNWSRACGILHGLVDLIQQ